MNSYYAKALWVFIMDSLMLFPLPKILRTTLLRAEIAGYLFVSALRSDGSSITAAVQHFGACDGSNGIAVGQEHFVSATDESNTFCLYSTASDSKATKLDVPLNAWAHVPAKKKHPGEFHECDLEGAAKIEQRIYWIGSHGRNKDGELCPERELFFATDINSVGEKTTLKLVGEKPYGNLIADLLADSVLADPKLEEVKTALLQARANDSPDPRKAPKEKGSLNIESLCADGNTLLIGFRNPIPGDKALLVPLTNPKDVLEKGDRAKFGRPLLLDLGGLGIRDMVRWRNGFLIIAGDYRDGFDPDVRASKLFRWEGGDKPPVALNVKMDDLNPEAAVVFGQGANSRLLLLSDDGSKKINGGTVKDLEESKQFFRSFWLEDSGKAE
jgi:Protein of unknown function (DUF3616)